MITLMLQLTKWAVECDTDWTQGDYHWPLLKHLDSFNRTQRFGLLTRCIFIFYALASIPCWNIKCERQGDLSLNGQDISMHKTRTV